MQKIWLIRLSIGGLLAGSILGLACNPSPPVITPAIDLSTQVPGRNLRVNPPRVENVSARLTDESGKALLLVRFAQEERLPALLSVELEDGVTVVRDDGQGGDEKAQDGIFSTPTSLNLAELRANEARLRGAPQKTFAVFEGRRKVREQPIGERLFDLRPGGILDLTPIGLASSVDATRSLMITDPAVVQDPSRTRTSCMASSMGKWSFGYLMEQMANTPVTGITASAFVRRWLNRWMFDQSVNDWTVAKRINIKTQVIDPWETASGGAGNPLDLSKAPFRLLAIVNRVDLRANLGYGGGSAGEARFVFGVIGPSCNVLPFTVIFEYGITKRNCTELKAWGKQWKDLDTLTLGTPAFNDALQLITERFVAANAAPEKPNGSALNQLRTNEIALASPWELREFKIFATDSDAHHLRLVTVKQTPNHSSTDPSLSLNNTVVLANYVNANAASIKAQTHNVPLEFPLGSHFLGGSSLTPGGMFWNQAGITDREARHMFSLQTCNGCHAGETNTPFTHIFPQAYGNTPVSLSGFLKGITVGDPADGGIPSRTFNDLERRQADLDALLNSSCKSIVFRPELSVLRMTH